MIFHDRVAKLICDGANDRDVNIRLLSRIDQIPDIIGFTTGMGEQVLMRDIAEMIRDAGLDANCDLSHTLYAFAMGWSTAPVSGGEHGAFSRLKAVRVLRQFPNWPEYWHAQLEGVAISLRPPPRPPPYEPEGLEAVLFWMGVCLALIGFFFSMATDFVIEIWHRITRSSEGTSR